MEFKEFDVLISQGPPAPIYHLLGEEAFLRKEALARIERAVEKTAETYAGQEHYTADDNWTDAVSSLYTAPLFGDAKLVVVSDLEAFIKSRPSAGERLMKDLEHILAKPPEQAFLVLLCEHIDGRTKLARWISERACEVNCSPLKPFQVEKWLQGRCRKEKLRMAPGVVNSLIARTNGSLETLVMELDKLALFARAGEEITEKDLALLVDDRAEEPVYLLYNALDRGDKSESYQILEDILSRVESPIQIVAGLSRHVRQLLALQAMQREGRTEQEIQSRLEMSSFQVKKMAEASSNLKQRQLRRMLQMLERADERLKGLSRSGEITLYELVALADRS